MSGSGTASRAIKSTSCVLAGRKDVCNHGSSGGGKQRMECEEDASGFVDIARGSLDVPPSPDLFGMGNFFVTHNVPRNLTRRLSTCDKHK